ncbi:hypothetical protein CKAH01_04746 [Colletotrichum kahawae]|uniref:Secreted protein n=1 Tax=Colletotrichum kahawae TaxID=34407 RepID=A0AAD9YIB9_COLKA|nr:hypothetical protein CKAH01_04746 [Colletotrichum kahawae]
MLQHPPFLFLTLFCLPSHAHPRLRLPSALSPFRHCFFCFSSCSLPRYHPPRLSSQNNLKRTSSTHPPTGAKLGALPFPCLASPGPLVSPSCYPSWESARPARGKGLKFENNHHLPESTPGRNRSP